MRIFYLKFLNPLAVLSSYPNSEEVSKLLFVRVCLEVDASKSLRMKIKYFRNDSIYECFIDYKTITTFAIVGESLSQIRYLLLELKKVSLSKL